MECLSYVDLSHDYSKSIIFNNMSPHYKHIYLCHPPFKHLSPVSDMYEAKLEASRSYFLVPPPSAPLRVHQ